MCGGSRWAAAHGHLSVVSYLVEQKANIHADNEFALRWATAYGHLSVVSYLVGQGADISKLQDDHIEKILLFLIRYHCFVSSVDLCRRRHENKQFIELQKLARDVNLP